MISIELTDTKDFMNKLLRTEIFDNFLLQEAVITKARDYLKELEGAGKAALPARRARDDGQVSLADVGMDEVKQILRDTDLNTLTPIEAMNLLFSLQKKARG